MDVNEIIQNAVREVLKQMNEKGETVTNSDAPAPASMAKYIDHTLLKPNANLNDIKKLCDEAKENRFASICINTGYASYAAEQLSGSGVTLCVVVGFPLGACSTETKVYETLDAIRKGAREIDMVINVGMLKSRNLDFVLDDIRAVVKAASGSAIVKVIIETCLLTNEEKVIACQLSKQAGAAFVKTSTGFSTGGATVEDVKLMRETVGPHMGVKASGGVKNYDDAVAMIKAGANRLGTSSGVSIVKGVTANAGHTCVNCGRCKAECPSGNSIITKTCY